MKTSTKVILGGLAMLISVPAALFLRNRPAAPPKVTVPMPSSITKMPTQMIDSITIEPLEPPSAFSRRNPASQEDLNTAKSAPIPPEMIGVTDDPAVVAFLKNYDPIKQEVGDVKDTENHTQQLFINGKILFEANQIMRRRTMAQDGTIVLAAVKEASIEPAVKTEIKTLPSTIWMIDPSGIKKQVSPPNVNASTPLISPDGKRIAFTGISVGADGSEEEPLLWVYDLTTKQYRKFASSKKGHDFSVGAAEWSADSKVLYVLEDYGETRGHMVMKHIKF